MELVKKKNEKKVKGKEIKCEAQPHAKMKKQAKRRLGFSSFGKFSAVKSRKRKKNSFESPRRIPRTKNLFRKPRRAFRQGIAVRTRIDIRARCRKAALRFHCAKFGTENPSQKANFQREEISRKKSPFSLRSKSIFQKKNTRSLRGAKSSGRRPRFPQTNGKPPNAIFSVATCIQKFYASPSARAPPRQLRIPAPAATVCSTHLLAARRFS